MKYIKYLFVTLIMVIGISSCTFEEKSLFDDTAAVRMKKTLSNYEDILCSAQNGWAVEYFPTDTTEGYTFIMKFNSSMKVEIATQNKWINNKFTKDSCVFQLLSDDGPVLSFPVAGNYIHNGNQIGLFHMFSNPESITGTTSFRGYGLKGDYEFVITNATSDLITLKGKKRDTEIYMRKLASGMVWENYFNQINVMKNSISDELKEPLGMVIGTDSFNVITNMSSYGSYSNKYRLYPTGGNSLTDGKDVAFIITPYGIRFHTPFGSTDLKVQSFVLESNKQYLVCNDTNVTAHIFNKLPKDYFIYKMNSSYKWQISTNDADMSTSVKTVIDQCKASLGAAGRSLVGISFRFNSVRNKNTVYIVFKNTSTSTEANWDYTMIKNGKEAINFNFEGTYDSNGSLLYTKFNGFSNLAALINGNFTISSTTGLILNKLKITSVSNPDNWFYINRQ